MRKGDLQFYRNAQIMRQLFHEPTVHKTAQDSLGGALSSLTDHVKSQYDANHKIESVLAFMVPGVLWTFGFRWIAVIYELAEALGWNWREFFTSIREKLAPFLHGLEAGEHKDSSEITNMVQESVASSFGGDIDIPKITDLIAKSDLNDLFLLKKMAAGYRRQDQSLIERMLRAGTGTKFKRGIAGFLIRVFSLALTAIIVSLGFSVGGSLVSKVLGIKKDKPEESKEQTKEEPKEVAKSDKQEVSLDYNEAANPKLLESHKNEKGNIWILDGRISQIKQYLIAWAQELYPQLTDMQAFQKSSFFQNTLKLFQTRNKGAEGLDIIAVPTPFTSIKDIVDSFAADVAANKSA